MVAAPCLCETLRGQVDTGARRRRAAGGARRAGRSLGARGNRPPVPRLTLASRTDGRRTPRARHRERGRRGRRGPGGGGPRGGRGPRGRGGGDRRWPRLAVTTFARRARPKVRSDRAFAHGPWTTLGRGRRPAESRIRRSRARSRLIAVFLFPRARMPRVSHPVAKRVVIHGSVQGVFFRETTRRRAESRGVSGWVRNCSDGTVEALFEGEPEAVEAMVAFAREGPRAASVERVDVEDAAPEGGGGFAVR